MSSFIIITIISAIGVRHLSLLEEAESFLSSVDTRHVFDWHKVLDSMSLSIPLFAGSIVLSYVGVKRNIAEMVAALTERIKQKQIQVAILCYKRSWKEATVGTKAWVIEKLMRNNALCFYDDSLDHLYSAFQVGARTFLVRSGGLSNAEIAKTSVDFSTELIHVPSLIHYLRGKEPGAKKKTSLIHRFLYSNASLLARGFYVTLCGPCGNELQNSCGETINVLDSADDINYIVYENGGEILFHRSYKSRKDFQDKAKELIKYL